MQVFDLAHSLVDNAVTAVAQMGEGDVHFYDLFTPAGLLEELLRSLGAIGSFGSS